MEMMPILQRLQCNPLTKKIVGAGWGASGATTTDRNPTAINFVVFRLNTDGTLDSSFGKQTFNFGGVSDKAFAVTLQPDGKVLVAGSTTTAGGVTSIAIARLNTNGSFDTTFNGSGQQIINFGGNDAAYGVALNSKGDILLAGSTDTPANDFLVTELVNNISS